MTCARVAGLRATRFTLDSFLAVAGFLTVTGFLVEALLLAVAVLAAVAGFFFVTGFFAVTGFLAIAGFLGVACLAVETGRFATLALPASLPVAAVLDAALLLAIVLVVLVLLAGVALRLRFAVAFPADDFFAVLPAVLMVVVLRVTDFFSALAFMGYASIICLSSSDFSE